MLVTWKCTARCTLRMKTLLVVAAIILAASAANVLDEEWNIWKATYDKNYVNTKEEIIRRNIWEETWHKVQAHNGLAERGLRNYTLAVNMFADMTVQELIPRKSCRSKSAKPKLATSPSSAANSSWDGQRPDEEPVDWRTKGCVGPVKNSGVYCYPWWAFAAVGVLESRYCIKHKRLYKFSEQQMIDCNSDNEGCCSGTFQSIFDYAMKRGLMASRSYKYQAGQFECKYNAKKAVKVKVSKFYTLVGEASIASAVTEDGPVAVTIDVSLEFLLYNGGIFDGECAEHTLGMTIVGLGSTRGTDYWILRNTFGKEWGESGYVRVKRNKNLCGIGDQAVAGDIAS